MHVADDRTSRPSQFGGCDSCKDVACYWHIVHTRNDVRSLIAPDFGKPTLE